MTIARRLTAIFLSACLGAAISMGVASARMSGPQTFKPSEGMIYALGAKRAIGFFLNSGGRCQVTLIIANALDSGVSQAPAAPMSGAMLPGQSLTFAGADGEAMVLTCGAGGETIDVRHVPSTRS